MRKLLKRSRESHQMTAGRGRKLRGVLALTKPYRGRVLLMFASLLVATAAGLAPAPLAKLAIDSGISKGDLGTLNIVVILFVLSALLLWGATYLQTYLVGWIGQHVLADLRKKIFKKLQSLSVGFYERNRSGVLISRITNDVQALDQLITDGIVTLFQATLTLAGSIAVLFWLDAELALATMIIAPLLFVGSFIFRLISANAYRQTRVKIGAITAYLQESLSGVRLVRAYAQEPRHKKEFSELNDENRDANMKTVYLNASYFPAIELLTSLATILVILLGGFRALEGDLTIGILVGFIAALDRFFDPIQQLSQLYTTYQSGMAALDKIFELLDEEPEDVESSGKKLQSKIKGNIAFQGVSFRYKEDSEEVLHQINLDIKAGQTVALVGHTGAGKSTIVKLISRFYDPTGGQVLIDGQPLTDIEAKSLRLQMGVVAQDGFLFSGTVRENIQFGKPGASDAEVQQAVEAVGAHRIIAGLPEGYDTDVGERGVHLSSGQQQLVAFARAFIADPRILILDEATSHIDPHTEQAVQVAVNRLLNGRTAIVIAHRLSTVKNADLTVVLEEGRAVQVGTHSELLKQDGPYRRLNDSWSKAHSDAKP